MRPEEFAPQQRSHVVYTERGYHTFVPPLWKPSRESDTGPDLNAPPPQSATATLQRQAWRCAGGAASVSRRDGAAIGR
jgi:hypothetical protein